MVAAGWKPTVENYLGRVAKPRILMAVAEAKDDQTAGLIDHLKKGDMAREAERLLADADWLPEPLRTPMFEDAFGPAAVDRDESVDGDAEVLPAFLGGAGVDRKGAAPGKGVGFRGGLGGRRITK